MNNDNTIAEYATLLRELGKNQRVLFVDDDGLANKMAVRFLLQFFLNVDSAHNGQEAIEQYKKYRYDIVITDICMPQMDGLELCKRIREININQRIVVISAFNDTDYLLKALQVGVSDYIFKPMDFSYLLKVLYRISKAIMDEYLNERHYSMILEQNQAILEEKNLLLKKIELLEEELKILRDNPKAAVLTQNIDNEKHKSTELFINQNESAILDTSRTSKKVSAMEFNIDNESAIAQKIPQLRHSIDELKISADRIFENQEDEDVYQCIANLQQAIFTISDFPEFRDISFSLERIEQAFSKSLQNAYRKEIYASYLLQSWLFNLVNNMKNWINNIFITQTAQDIYYMNESFMFECGEVEKILLNLDIVVDNSEDSIVEFF